MMRKTTIPLDEKGNAVVLVLMMMVVLLGFTALVVDAGVIYLNRAKLANAMDSAVLAGAQVLPTDPEQVADLAAQYAALNGITDEVIIDVDDEGKWITAEVDKEFGLYFARILGFQSVELNAASQASVAPISGANNIVPFGVLEQELTFGETVILKEGGGDGTSGWFGALRLGGNGACVYRNNIKYGYSGDVKIGNVVPTESGNMSGPTSDGIAYRINQCNHVPSCSIHSYVDGCSKILIVPIVTIKSQNNGGHISSVRIVSFAAFLVDAYVGSGKNNEVEGAFIKYVIPGTTDENAADYGLYGCKLTK